MPKSYAVEIEHGWENMQTQVYFFIKPGFRRHTAKYYSLHRLISVLKTKDAHIKTFVYPYRVSVLYTWCPWR